MPKYTVDGKQYAIPDNRIEDFEKKYPNATIEYYNDGDIYDIPLSKREVFLAKLPNATTQQPIAKEEQPKGLLSRLFGNDEEKAERSDFKQPLKASQEVKQDNTPNIRPITSDSIQPRLTEQPDVAEDEVAEFYNRRQELQKTANRQQVADLSADIESQLERRGKELDAIAAQNPMMMQAHGTAMSIPVFDAGRTTDPEIRDYQAAKRAMENARNIINEADINAKNGKGSSFAAGAARGFGQKFFDLNTYDMGLSDLSDNAAMLKALETADENPDALTPSQQALLDAKAVELATNAYFGSSVGRGYKAGQVTAEAIPFMLEMAINPAKAVGQSLTNKLTRYALKRFGNKEIQKQGAKYVITKAGAKVLGDVAAASGMTATTGAARTAADAVQRMAGGVSPNMQREDGRVEFWKRTQGEESPIKAIAKAFAGTTIENYSEMIGEYFSPVLSTVGGLSAKALDKLGLGKVNRFIDDVSSSDFAQLVKDFEGHAKWNGTIGEFAEEIAGGVLNAAIVGDQTLDNKEGTGVFNKENLIDTFLGVSLLGGAFSGVKTAYYPIYKYEAYNAVNSAKDDLMEAFKDSENVEELERSLSTPQDAANALAKIAISPNFDPNKFEAAARYAQAIQRYNGALLGEQKRRTGIIVEAPEQLEVEQSYDNGRTLESPQEMNDANNQLGYAAAEVRRVFVLDEDTDIDNFLGADPVTRAKEERENDEEIGQAILDYLNAKATYDGMIDGVRANIEAQQRHSDNIINQRANKEDGMIHPALRKDNDRPVYIINGNIALNDDGTIDNEKSSESVVYLDAETGKLDFAKPSDFHQVSQPIDAEEEKTIARNQIAEELAQKASDKIDGVLPFQPNDVYPVLGADGSEHNLQVIADQGDGSVAVKVDGVDGVIPKDEIQQMANAYNLARRDAYNEERKAERMAEQEVIQPQAEQNTEQQQEQTPKRVIPTLKDGKTPDFNAMNSEMFVDEYVSRYGEDSAIKIARKNIANAKDNIAKIDKKIDDITDPNQMESLYVQRKDVEEQLNRYNDILSRLGASEDANETEADQQSRLKKEAGNRIASLFPNGMPNVESFILADIATGNRLRWSDKTANGAVTSKGLGAELGLSEAERRKRLPLIGKEAMTPEEYAESLKERLESVGIRYDESSLRDAVLDVYSSVDSRNGAWEALESIANKAHEQEVDTDWESMQQERAYKQAQSVEENIPELPNLETIEEETPISEGEYAEMEAKAQTEEQKDYDAMMAENPPVEESVEQQIEVAEQDTNPQPTEAQKKAGNYKKGHIKIDGFDITIETPKGVERKGVDEKGNPWSVIMNNTYGYIRGTEGVDGDHIDMFLSDNLDNWNGNVYVIDQIKPDGSFDEHKVMYGFDAIEDAQAAYLSNYSEGWKGLGSISGTTKEEFKKWIASSHRKTKPFAEYKSVKTAEGQSVGQTTEDKVVEQGETERSSNEAANIKSVTSVSDSEAQGAEAVEETEVQESTAHSSILSEEEYIDKILAKRKPKNISTDEWEFSDEYVAYNKAADGYPDYIKGLADSGELQKAFDRGTLGDQIAIRKSIQAAGYDVSDLISTNNKKKPKAKKSRGQELMDNLGLTKTETENLSKPNNYRFRSVYHGSGSDFEKFDHSHMGTGEGHQAFGWGTYVTEVEGIGKQYAKMVSKPRLTFNGEFVNTEGFYNPWRLVEGLYNDSQGKLREMRAKAERYSSLVEADDTRTKTLWEDVKQVLSNVRSGDLNMKPARYLYSIEIPDNDGTNYLEHDKSVPKEQLNKIKQALYNRLEADTHKGVEQDLKEELDGIFGNELDGSDVYGTVGSYLGSDKAASQFLNENGYVGISYPADNGKAKGARNYVIFNEQDLDITNNIRFRPAESSNVDDAVEAKAEKVFNNTKAIATAYGIDNSIVVATSEADFKTKMLEAGVEDDYIDQDAIAVYIPETGEIVINSQKATSDENLVESVIHEKAHSLTHNIEKWRAIYDAIIPVGEDRFVEFANNVLKENLSPIKSADEIIATFVGKSAILQTEDGRYLVRAMLNNRITSEDIISYLQSSFPNIYAQYGDVLTAMHPFIQDSLETIKKQYNERRNNVSVSRFGTNTRASNRGNAYRELATPTSDRGSSTIEGVSEVRREPSERRGRTVEERTQSRILAATSLAESLGVKLNVVEDVNDITDANSTMQRNKRGSKGWYDVDTDQVYFVAPNATSIQDAEESVLHEVVAHKGLRDVVGRERFDAFLGKVYRGASPEIRKAITELAAKKGWDFRVATEEYLASLAERGFEDKENRTFWQKVRDLFMDMLREAKIILGYDINDNDLRYMLWRTYQMQKSKGVMAAAEDVVMQQKLGVGNFRTRPMGESMTEEEQIIADAKANGTYLKAPNGKDTNLTPKQWAQVRTKAFKEWFGDWELAAIYDYLTKLKAVKAKPMPTDKSSEDVYKSLPKAKNKIDGTEVRFFNSAYGKVVKLGGVSEKIIASLPKIFEESILSYTEKDNRGGEVRPDGSIHKSHPNLKEVRNYVGKVGLDGKEYYVRFTVNIQKGDNGVHSYFATDISLYETKSANSLSESNLLGARVTDGGIVDTKLEKFLAKAKFAYENSSKIVDANGEPKLVWHGGQFAMSNFVPRGAMHFGTKMAALERILDQELGYDDVEVTKDADGNYSWAYTDPYDDNDARSTKSFETEMDAYEDAVKTLVKDVVVKPYYLNIKNIEKTDDAGSDWADAIEMAKEDGYDGIKYENWYEDKGSESYIAFEPTQIKSATDNVGSFDATNPDVRFRSAGNQAAEDKRKAIRAEYDKIVNTGRKGTLKATKYNFIESMQDEMLSLKEYQELLKKHYGLEKLPSYLDAYMRENRISSAGYEEFLRFEDGVYEDMNSIIDEYINKGESYENIKEYAIAKSGLERNREFTVRDYIDDKANEKLISKTEAEAQLAQVVEELKNDVITPTEADAKRQQIQNLRSQNKLNAEDVKALKEDYAKKRDAYRKQLSDGHISYSEFNKLSDALAKKFTGRSIEDYSGLSAMAEKKGEKADKWQTVAQDVVAAFESKHKDTDKLWNAIKACNDAVLKKMSDSGLLNDDVYSHLRQQFVWYIPMSGFTEDTAEDVYSYVGNETGAFTPAVKKAAGRLSESDDPFAIIGNKMQGAILQGNRNLLKQTLLNLSRTYPTDLITEDKVWLVKQQDGTWETNMVDIPEGATSEEAAKLIKEHSEKMRKLKKQGLAMEQTNKLSVPYKVTVRSHKNDHEIVAYRNGVPVVMYVNGNPQLAKAINGKLKDRNINIFYELLDKWNRIMSANKTSWNPDFIAPNVLRDFEDAIMSTFIDAGVKDAAKLAKTVVLVFPEVVRSVSGSKNKSGKYANYFEEFLQNGGETGYSHLRDVEKWKEINQRRWKRLNLGEKALKAPKETFDGIGSMFSYLNRIAEDTTRFGTYVYNREQGKSIGESIKAAKDITTNFNKKGSGATEGIWGFLANFMRRWLLFFNPMVQGLYKHWERMNKNSMRYALVFAAMAGGGYLAAVLNKAASDDDDEEKKYFNQSDYTRRTNIMVYTGDGYVKIPLAPVFREMYALGDIMYSVQSGVITPWEGTKEVVNLVRSLFNLEGQSSLKDQDFSWFRFVIPQSTEFMADIEDNVTFTGAPLYKDTPWNKFDPEYQKVYKGTWTPLVKLSKAVNDILPHEGYMHEVDDQMAGKGSSKWINPAVWQHIIEEVAGGVGKAIGDVITVGDNILNKKETDIYNIPIAKRFYSEPDERTRGRILKNQYYNATGELEKMNNKYKKYTDYLLDNLSDPLEIAAKITEYWDSDAGKLHNRIKNSKSKVDNLDKQLKAASDDATAEEITLMKENEMKNLIEFLKTKE